MKTIEEFYQTIESQEKLEIFSTLIETIQEKYSDLKLEIKWSQPIFSKDGSFIIGFSLAKNHISIAGEHAGLNHVRPYLDEKKIDYGAQVIRQLWDKPIDYDLVYMLIDFNIEDKKGYKKFWR